MQWDEVQMEIKLVLSVYEKHEKDHFPYTFETVPNFSSSRPCLDHEIKITPVQHPPSFILHCPTNLLKTVKKLSRINFTERLNIELKT